MTKRGGEMMERSKALEVTIRVRPEVAKYAELMEQKLRANDHKGHWRESSLSYLIARLREECGELIDAVLYEEGSTPDHITEEAADVANFAMFIADVAGGLRLDTEDVGSVIQLNKNMAATKEHETDIPVWRCPRCKDMSILADFYFCPACGRRIEWVDVGLDGPNELEKTEPVDPFANVTNRYRLFCLDHGAESPEEMKRFVDEVGGPFYMTWISGWLRKWKSQHGYNADYMITDKDHADFDAWLAEQVLGGDSDGN